MGQRGNLWFLAGNTGGRTERQCALPAGNRVLIPLHNTFCSPHDGVTEAQCYDAVAQDYQSFASWQIRVNDVPHAAGRWAIVDLAQPGVYTLNVQSQRPGFSTDVTYRLFVAEIL